MATRVGPYVWDVDLDTMGIDELDALKEACEFYTRKKEISIFQNRFNDLIQEIKTAGYDLCYDQDESFFILDSTNTQVMPQED